MLTYRRLYRCRHTLTGCSCGCARSSADEATPLANRPLSVPEYCMLRAPWGALAPLLSVVLVRACVHVECVFCVEICVRFRLSVCISVCMHGWMYAQRPVCTCTATQQRPHAHTSLSLSHTHTRALSWTCSASFCLDGSTTFALEISPELK